MLQADTRLGAYVPDSLHKIAMNDIDVFFGAVQTGLWLIYAFHFSVTYSAVRTVLILCIPSTS